MATLSNVTREEGSTAKREISARCYLEIQDGDSTIRMSPKMQAIFSDKLTRLSLTKRSGRFIAHSFDQECPFYKYGNCSRNLACEYIHPGSELLQGFVRKMDGICKDFLTTEGCNSLSECRREHLTLEQVATRFYRYQQILKDYPERFAPL